MSPRGIVSGCLHLPGRRAVQDRRLGRATRTRYYIVVVVPEHPREAVGYERTTLTGCHLCGLLADCFGHLVAGFTILRLWTIVHDRVAIAAELGRFFPCLGSLFYNLLQFGDRLRRARERTDVVAIYTTDSEPDVDVSVSAG